MKLKLKNENMGIYIYIYIYIYIVMQVVMGYLGVWKDFGIVLENECHFDWQNLVAHLQLQS